MEWKITDFYCDKFIDFANGEYISWKSTKFELEVSKNKDECFPNKKKIP